MRGSRPGDLPKETAEYGVWTGALVVDRQHRTLFASETFTVGEVFGFAGLVDEQFRGSSLVWEPWGTG